MKNLGKIFIILSLLNISVFANVLARVNPNIVYAGESATYILTISGENIEKPNITNICGNSVTGRGSQTSIVMMNGDYKKSYTLSYSFMPTKSCTIEAISVNIDSKIEKSNPISLIVKPVQQDLSADFILSLKSSKKNVYVGEPFNVSFTLKQKRDAEVVDSKFNAPSFKGFWIKSQSKAVTIDDGAYRITTLEYRIAAQRDGNATITPAQIQIAQRVRGVNNWGSLMPQVRWKNYYSNSLNVEINPLPNGAKLIGDFVLSAKAETLEINANEALNLEITVLGEGNLEDITSFKPYVDNVNVFDEKMEVKKNSLSQKLVFVSDNNFSIPSFSLSYFSTKTHKIETIRTKPIHIFVKGAKVKKDLKIKREEKSSPVLKTQIDTNTKNTKSNVAYFWLFISLLLGILIGIAIMFLKESKIFRKSLKIDLSNEKVLLMKLLPYKDEDYEVQKIVDILEANIYGNTVQKVNKKDLKAIIKKYDIS